MFASALRAASEREAPCGAVAVNVKQAASLEKSMAFFKANEFRTVVWNNSYILSSGNDWRRMNARNSQSICFFMAVSFASAADIADMWLLSMEGDLSYFGLSI